MIVDKVGQEITIGCWIAYGHALGRCAGLRIGKVLAITATPHEYKENVTEYKISVRGIDDDWSFCGPTLNTRNGTLLHPDRILVLADALVPQAYRDLMAKGGF